MENQYELSWSNDTREQETFLNDARRDTFPFLYGPGSSTSSLESKRLIESKQNKKKIYIYCVVGVTQTLVVNQSCGVRTDRENFEHCSALQHGVIMSIVGIDYMSTLTPVRVVQGSMMTTTMMMIMTVEYLHTECTTLG